MLPRWVHQSCMGYQDVEPGSRSGLRTWVNPVRRGDGRQHGRHSQRLRLLRSLFTRGRAPVNQGVAARSPTHVQDDACGQTQGPTVHSSVCWRCHHPPRANARMGRADRVLVKTKAASSDAGCLRGETPRLPHTPCGAPTPSVCIP